MNLLLTALPVITSLSILISSVIYFFSVRSVTSVKVPYVAKEKIEERKIIDGFSKVFVPIEKEKREDYREYTFKAETVKNVELLGISKGSKNMALLRVDGKTLILSEGETKKGITLKKVLPDSVVLLISHREQTVKLKKTAKTSVKFDSSSRSAEGEFRISRREVERITRDPGIMFRQIRLVPYVKNGKTEGFIFEWIKPGSLFYKAGLRKGDVLVSINNMTIKSGEDAFRILQMLRNEPSLKIVVLRKGQRKEINVRIE